ncbi:endoplasmin [Anaeramoeba ignava]|uniref:Endoplasmin n=1 Tax=Anaeramoeba ignava TaxID=1746090 RepID=A0A9Q0LYZ6_ANAIG|nr:endoplasmin [Anaeramoeba ignava]|eukprot:Anaeramoba_ignava/a90790_122.p1 GENE.a90790_122~~a90790_122.p1  ORF type:complete len:849 (-),score=310.03 a90790_122:56-2479(-)
MKIILYFLFMFLLLLRLLTTAEQENDEPIEAKADPIIENDIVEDIGHKTAPGKTEIDEEIRKQTQHWSHDEQELIKETMESFKYQADTAKLMELIINSIYSNKEIFLRELISNASDALQKIRFLSLLDASKLGSDTLDDLKIKIAFDSENRLITITDNGIGMTKNDLVNNIGRIAQSGSKQFLDKLHETGDLSGIIGQFGVGFYSVFLVSDSVTVISKHNDDPTQWIWRSDLKGVNETSYTISPDPRGNTLGRGTSIVLHISEDSELDPFLDQEELTDLVIKYSQFIDFPIYMYKYVWENVPIEKKPENDEKQPEKEPENEPVTDFEIEEDEPENLDQDEKIDEPETERIQMWKWVMMNPQKPIWIRNSKDISPDEYNSFFKMLSKKTEDPMTYIHFSAEGEAEFRSILYVPGSLPFGSVEQAMPHNNKIKLYVKRVFITDNFLDELLPTYLSFIMGVVDSDNLPLNLSREMLQKHRLLKLMKNKLTRKCLEMIRKIFQEDDDVKKSRFWSEFGTYIKGGIIEEKRPPFQNKLIDLVRFYSSKSEDKMVTLKEYAENMKEDQKAIYYIGGSRKEVVAQSPHIERLKEMDYEVLYLIDPIDEYCVLAIDKYNGTRFVDASKESLFASDEENKIIEELEEEYEDLISWFKMIILDKVDRVTISRRLKSSPCVISSKDYGVSANLERILKAQPLNQQQMDMLINLYKKTFEINPNHPIIKNLHSRIKENQLDAKTLEMGKLLYETALVSSGYQSTDTPEYTNRVFKILGFSLGVEENEVEFEVEEEQEEQEDEVEFEEQEEIEKPDKKEL